MPKMTSTTGTDYLNPVHRMTVVLQKLDSTTGNHFIKTWPAGS